MDDHDQSPVFAQPFNRKFLSGQARRIRGALWMDWLFGTLISLPALLQLNAILQRRSLDDSYAVLDALTAALALIALAAAILWIGRKEWASIRFSTRGTLLDGVLDRVEVWDIPRNGRRVNYAYSFYAPDGRKITGTRAVFRNDTGVFAYPTGSPVKVLYIDDRSHRML